MNDKLIRSVRNTSFVHDAKANSKLCIFYLSHFNLHNDRCEGALASGVVCTRESQQKFYNVGTNDGEKRGNRIRRRTVKLFRLLVFFFGAGLYSFFCRLPK